MKTMSWAEIDNDWGGLQKRHRGEIAQAVARYCIGHGMREVAEHLGYSLDWLRTQLDVSGISIAAGGSENSTPLTGVVGDVSKDVPRIIKDYRPSVRVKLADDGEGNQSVDSITGDDSDEFEPYLDHYIREGHEPAAATRLAAAEWAGEAAVEAGVIKESRNKRNEKVNKITFPEHDDDTFAMDLKLHVARVEAAARFLDNAKMSNLRKESTCEKVASAHAKWLEQVERIRNLHPTFA